MKKLIYVGLVVFIAFNIFFFKKVELPEKSEVKLCGEQVPIDRVEVKQSLEKAILKIKKDYGKNIFFLENNFLFSFIEEELQNSGLPTDLKYVAVVESALNPRAISEKGAGGLWQFMPDTAGEYGLEKDDFIDQRFDPFTSTEAAIRYLKSLNERFKNWPDTLAGYNMDQDKYAKAKFEQKAEDFYQVKNIYPETREFIFKVIAVKLIMENPREYGYRNIPPYQYTYKNWQIQKVPVNVEGPVSLSQIVESLKNHYPDWNSDEFSDYNSHILQRILPTGSYYVYVKQNGTS